MEEATTTAKRFTFAAIGFAAFAPLWALIRPGTLDLYLHDTYFVVAHFHVASAAAVICAIFGLLYFGCGRLLHVSMNRGLSLASFLLIVVPISAMVLELFVFGDALKRGFDPKLFESIRIAASAAMLCVSLGSLLFALNLSWALVRMLWRGNQSHPEGNA